MLVRKWIANGHGPAMLVALFLSLLAGAPTAANANGAARTATLEQASGPQAVFVKKTPVLQALRAPQPTPLTAIIPGEIGFAACPIIAAATLGFQTPGFATARAERRPQQPRAPPAI